MTCQVARQWIQDSLDGTLLPADLEALQGHLETCAACAADHARLREAVSALESLPPVTAPAELLSRLAPELDALSQASAKPARRRAWAWVPTGAIAAGLLVALALTQFQPGPPSDADLVAMEPPSAELILEWVDASAEPMDLFDF